MIKVTPELKICSKCKKEWPLTEYYSNKRAKDGFKYQCKSCVRDDYWKKRDLNLESRRQWYQDNKEKAKIKATLYKQKTPEQQKIYRRKERLKTYKLTEQSFAALYDKQEGRCAICDIFLPLNDLNTVPFIDHNHDTGEVRGLLCRTCNTGLGMFKDSPVLLENAKKYLEEKGNY